MTFTEDGGPSGTTTKTAIHLSDTTAPTNEGGGTSGSLLTPNDLTQEMSDANAEMKDVGNKRGREETGEEQVQAKRGSTPVHDGLQGANKDATTKKDQTTDEQEDEQMREDL
jgi:hypothetical protein